MTANLDHSAGPGRPKIRVLLVDDHRIMREQLRRIIEEQADMIVVAEASDGYMAVSTVREIGPDVVIMDVHMPKMNGVEATRRIKAELPQIMVIGLSLRADEQTAVAMRKAGATAYFSKNVSLENLCAAIRSVKAKTF